MKPIDQAKVELDGLVGLFFTDPEQLGQITRIEAGQLPAVPRQLLAHDHHMTVTLEGHYGGPVEVQVLATKSDGDHYARQILLTSQRDGKVVQFGIVRLDLAVLGEDVRREIESAQIPLGRVLINHNVWREVKLLGLYRIVAGEELAARFAVPPGTSVYGRTAVIWCNGSPAIELLEIVSGVDGAVTGK